SPPTNNGGDSARRATRRPAAHSRPTPTAPNDDERRRDISPRTRPRCRWLTATAARPGGTVPDKPSVACTREPVDPATRARERRGKRCKSDKEDIVMGSVTTDIKVAGAVVEGPMVPAQAGSADEHLATAEATPVTEYLPPFAVVRQPIPVTVRHLLDHSFGLANPLPL